MIPIDDIPIPIIACVIASKDKYLNNLPVEPYDTMETWKQGGYDCAAKRWVEVFKELEKLEGV